MSDVRTRPVARGRVLLASLLIVGGLAGIVTLAELLRHPLPDTAPGGPPADEPAGDPRAEVTCDEPVPREGQERSDEDAASASRQFVRSNELYDCPQQFDGRRVRYRGEVVGAILRRADGAWVQLNDDVYADALGPLPAHRDFRGGNAGVGVFVSHQVADAIDAIGGPGERGDILEISGVFHRVDPATAEVAIIRSSEASVSAAGEPLVDPALADRRAAAILFLLLAAGLTVAERIVARRR